MIDMFRTILEVARSLLGMSDQLRAADRQRRGDMAHLFEQIGGCLIAVSTEIRAGGVPHGRCAELRQYATALPDLVRDELGDAQAQDLGATLLSAYDVERVAMELHQVEHAAQKEPYLAEIEEASGKFRALANLVRLG